MESFLSQLQNNPITLVSFIVSVGVLGLAVVYAALRPRLFLLMIKNLRRNIVRTSLTFLATTVLVFMIIMIWTVLNFIEGQTTDKSADFKVIITERWQIPSRMPPSYANLFSPVALDPNDTSYRVDSTGAYLPNPQCIFNEYPELNITAKDFMLWSFYGGTTEKGKFSRETIIFFFAMIPDQIKGMMAELDDLPDEAITKLKATPEGVLLGREKMEDLKLAVGDTFRVYSLNYKDIDLDFKIVGTLPEGRYNTSAIMNYGYFNRALSKYKQTTGKDHINADKTINLIWLRVRDKETFAKVGHIIETHEQLKTPTVKCESESSGIGAFLDAYRDIFFGVKFILVPAVLVSMALVIANAISISVRERRTEMAVLKVLGFRPGQVMNLILGESLLVGAVSGLLAALATYVIFNVLLGGIQFRIAFFPAFIVPAAALFWGVAMGSITAFLGSIVPSLSARSVKVSEVFSKVA
ncbi:MAG: FtsX-like permease family protein [Gemmataceae bacterium]